MNIFTLEISIPNQSEGEPWIRTIEIKENSTLEQLHYYIQEIEEFDNDHLYEFSIGKSPRNRSDAIAEDAKLSEIYPLTGFKLYYLFDFGDSWLFQIKKSRKCLVEDSNVKYPRVVKSNGVNPDQYPAYEE